MTMSWGRIETSSYWLLFLVTFILVAIWESVRPRQNLSASEKRRWSRHGSLLVMGGIVSGALYRVSPILVAIAFSHSRFGLFNKLSFSFPVRLILTILLLDLLLYAVHWSYHAVPFLWRVHRVHHSDPDLDVSTGARHHPLEVILTQGANLAAIALLAAPPVAVLVVELLNCAQSLFSHANASLPAWFEKPLRWVFITPDMHRIHHSEEIGEQCSNLGDVFPWWDHIFRTYLDAPAAGHDRMVVGLKGCQNDASLGLAFMLSEPFRPDPEAAVSSRTASDEA
jgi:sterol desaturase/sphingolipid hydroxylase (fatty acid hydroxylase superfamily)